jgi:general secretion pathway protein L
MLTLDASDQQWVLRLQKGTRHQVLGRIDSQSPASAGRKILGTLIRKAKLRHAELTILLPENRSLRRPLDMPAITETDLRQALFFEIERQTPFRPEDVYFDYRVLARRPEAKRLTVELIAVPRANVDSILSQVHERGLQPSIVDVVARNAQSGIGINLLKADQAAARWSPLRVAFALLVVVLIAAAFYVPVNQLSAEDESLAAQVAEESAKAKQTLAKRAELDETVRAAGFLDERKQNVPGVLGVLNEVTKALPDNTWLLSLSQNKADVKISGYSAAAAELISRIDAVPLFKNPTFSSPIVQDLQNKLERFDISFEIKSGKR